jgi:hypothetical protein
MTHMCTISGSTCAQPALGYKLKALGHHESGIMPKVESCIVFMRWCVLRMNCGCHWYKRWCALGHTTLSICCAVTKSSTVLQVLIHLALIIAMLCVISFVLYATDVNYLVYLLCCHQVQHCLTGYGSSV